MCIHPYTADAIIALFDQNKEFYKILLWHTSFSGKLAAPVCQLTLPPLYQQPKLVTGKMRTVECGLAADRLRCEMNKYAMEFSECDKPKNKFFRLPGFVWLVGVPFGLTLLSVTVLAPNLVPYTWLGPLGQFTKLMAVKYPSVLKGIFYTALVLHSLEALYAIKVARSKNLCTKHVWMWTIQTCFYGLFGLKYLLHYEPAKQKTS